MKASEYIAAMQALIDEHGDLDVETVSGDLRRVSVRSPGIAHRKILHGRESTPRFWFSFEDESRKGEKVIAV